MKISTSIVSNYGYNESVNNEKRLFLLSNALESLQTNSIDLAVFPGGFLSSPDENTFTNLVNRVQFLSEKYNIYVVLGIDTKLKVLNEFQTNSIFAIVTNPFKKEPIIWEKRSSTSRDIISQSLTEETRNIFISSKFVEILVCGEIFNSKIRESLIDRKVDLVVDIAHTSQGFRIFSPMKILARNGIASFCAVHTKRKNGMKYCYFPTGENGFIKMSTRDVDIFIDDEPRMEIKFWQVSG